MRGVFEQREGAVRRDESTGGGGFTAILMGMLTLLAGLGSLYFGLFGVGQVEPALCLIGAVVSCIGMSLVAGRNELWRRRFLGSALLLWGLGFGLVALFPAEVLGTGAVKFDVAPTGIGRLAISGVGAVLALVGRGVLRGQIELGTPG